MTIDKFLKELMKENKSLKYIVNDSLKGISTEAFFEKFGNMDPETMAEFLLEGKRAYELQLWAHYKNGDKIGNHSARFDRERTQKRGECSRTIATMINITVQKYINKTSEFISEVL